MTELSHTPGPWSYQERNPTRVTGPNGETIAGVYGGFVGSEQQLANARLIASAPAMYEYVARRASEGDEEAQAALVGAESEDG